MAELWPPCAAHDAAAPVSTFLHSRASTSRIVTALVALAVVLAPPPPVRAQATPSTRPAVRTQRVAAQPPAWPMVTAETRPWTRWWWQGSAVNPADLTRNLEAFKRVGLGGVEITPIYGVRGAEQEFIPYLSPAWVSMLEHTLAQSTRLGLGVDMATGTGWPFGGPTVGDADAAKYVAWKRMTIKGGERRRDTISFMQQPLVRAVTGRVEVSALKDPIAATPNLGALAIDQARFPKPLPLVAVVAYSKNGGVEDVTSRVSPTGVVDLTAFNGEWTLYAIFQGWHGKQVERAAPGGEGNVIDHFARQAITDYLRRFDRAFAGRNVRVRSFFNDSYEVDDASGQGDWTTRMFDEFQARRGYDLRDHLPALLEGGTSDTARRVLSDYRQTVSDLVLDGFTKPWADWAHVRGSIVRNQAHGSPSNILDLYAASDIPETEGTEQTRLKFATSAAHVAGKRLASAEAATWLTEHFVTKLSDVRAALDNFFLAGVNHVVYHGSAYSPASEPWPGRLFYAAVEFNPQNSWWRDFAELNAYATRVQSFMQSGQPDNDVLLYFPIFDRFAERARVRGRESTSGGFSMPGAAPAGGFTSQGFSSQGTSPMLLDHFDAIPAWDSSAFRSAAEQMLTRGYMYDYVSDRQLAGARVEVNALVTSGNARYKTVLVPASKFIPIETMEQLVRLAEGGATVAFYRGLPEDVAGLNDLEARRARLAAIKSTTLRLPSSTRDVQRISVGRGFVLVSSNLDELLDAAGARREPAVDLGLKLIRRRERDGATYFIVNASGKSMDGWVPLTTTARSAAVYAAMHGTSGVGGVRRAGNGWVEVYLQFPAHASRIVRTYDTRDLQGAAWPYMEVAGPPVQVHGSWSLEFLSGGPTLPGKFAELTLGSWTALPGEAVKNFSGTARYRMEMPRPEVRYEGTSSWRFDFGTVHESARIILNGKELGTFFGPWFRVDVPDAALLKNNVVEVEVTNLMANRIADLDRRGVAWK
ncbi:MAG TPA: glycosyl hydrolase, partial [Gemmatimonadaceae bacterium]|nr:glycosyl hydrolase [Gemmatimonadaceae bacterium]